VATTSSSMHAARFTAVSWRFQPVLSLTAGSHDVDRGPFFGDADAPRTRGADVVVTDLAQLLDSA